MAASDGTCPVWQPQSLFEQSVYQVAQIRSMCDLSANEKVRSFLLGQQVAVLGMGRSVRQNVPPSIAQPEQIEVGNPLELRGLHTEAWHGLGIVGLWAAIDAYCERVSHKGAIVAMLDSKLSAVLPADLLAICAELDDLRNLYAHNFAGHADAKYFDRKRYALAPGQALDLASGAKFDGTTNTVHVDINHLEFYCERARDILGVLNATWGPA
jgi:hypothetical protein